MRHGPRSWRSLLAWYVLLTIAWPAAGPLPWLVVEHEVLHRAYVDEAQHHAAAYDADCDGFAIAKHEESDVPGSPTHPLDHDCAQCQVLKHLARCVLPDVVASAVAYPAGNPVHAFVVETDVRTGIAVPRTLIRGPPLVLS